MTQLVVGSVAAVAAAQGKAVAEAFMSVEVIALVDTSGSMEVRDTDASRYEVACRELALLQAAHPGKVAIISFATGCQFCPSGVPVMDGGSTNLTAALRFARTSDLPGVRFVVISDGQPDNEDTALAEARQFRGRIDVVYVGPEGGYGSGFMQRLAAIGRGQSVTAAHAQKLAPTIERLLLS